MESVPNFILSSGCDIPLETPPENIAAFMRAARKYR
jgi:uroporphyrinogen decarboxylase